MLLLCRRLQLMVSLLQPLIGSRTIAGNRNWNQPITFKIHFFSCSFLFFQVAYQWWAPRLHCPLQQRTPFWWVKALLRLLTLKPTLVPTTRYSAPHMVRVAVQACAMALTQSHPKPQALLWFLVWWCSARKRSLSEAKRPIKDNLCTFHLNLILITFEFSS